MLKPGVIPEKEPLLRVGIVLPEDKQKSLSLEVSDIHSITILINNSQTIPVPGNEIEISVKGTGIDLKGYDGVEPISNLKFIQNKNNGFILVNPVIAGRGFHWAKKISVKLPYNIEITVINDSLLVVNELPLEYYLACVATSEMGAECPGSFIEAQTIVARSWMLANVDEEGKYFRWTIKTSQRELVDNINDKLRINAKAVLSLIPLERAGSGRMLKLKINYLDDNAMKHSLIIEKDYRVRRVLHKMFLYSSAITIKEIKPEGTDYPEEFIFKGAGWGHGAGMCQIGALGMLLNGYNTSDILYHYYPGSQLKKLY